MAVAFARENFLADISDKELTALSTKLVNVGEPDDIAAYIARAQQLVDLYAGRWLLGTDHERRLISAVGLWMMEQRVGVISPKRQASYDAAMRELRDIRDGKFANLRERDPLPATINPTQGGWGSSPQINTSRFGGDC